MGKTANIYIKTEDEQVWEDFQKVCDANGWKYSEKIMEVCVRPIVAAHSGGGSQTLLDCAEMPLCMPHWKTCESSRKAIHDGTFFCGRAQSWLTPILCEMRVLNSGKQREGSCYRLDSKMKAASV